MLDYPPFRDLRFSSRCPVLYSTFVDQPVGITVHVLSSTFILSMTTIPAYSEDVKPTGFLFSTYICGSAFRRYCLPVCSISYSFQCLIKRMFLFSSVRTRCSYEIYVSVFYICGSAHRLHCPRVTHSSYSGCLHPRTRVTSRSCGFDIRARYSLLVFSVIRESAHRG